MSEYVYIYDKHCELYWKALGLGCTPHIEEAFPWSRATAEEVIAGGGGLVILEIETEEVLI